MIFVLVIALDVVDLYDLERLDVEEFSLAQNREHIQREIEGVRVGLQQDTIVIDVHGHLLNDNLVYAARLYKSLFRSFYTRWGGMLMRMRASFAETRG